MTVIDLPISIYHKTVDNPLLHEAMTFLHLLPLSTLIIISWFRGINKVTCLLLPTVPCLLISGPFKAITIAKWAQKAQDNPTQSHRISKCIGSYGRQNCRSWEYFPQMPNHQERQIKGLLLHITFWKVHLNIDNHNPVEHPSSHIWRALHHFLKYFSWNVGTFACSHFLFISVCWPTRKFFTVSLSPIWKEREGKTLKNERSGAVTLSECLGSVTPPK